MKYYRAGGLLLLSFASLWSLPRCSDGNEPSAHDSSRIDADAGASANDATRCVPGQTFPCMGACGQPLIGYQVCASDGRSYGECVCPEPSMLAPGASERPEGTFFSVPPPAGGLGAERPISPVHVPDSVGAPCRVDGDCAPGLDCFSATTDSLGAGGPAAGYCTVACEEHADCLALDAAAACASVSGQSLCARLCESQDPAPGIQKCLGREDLTCVSVAALGQQAPEPQPQIGICVPACQSDAACAGRRCDLLTGLCTDAPASGAPIGSACDTPDACAGGLCLRASEQTERFCSGFCTLGTNGCGFDGSEVRVEATCLLSQVPGEGAGDRGLCFELCDTAADCEQEGSLCVPRPEHGRAGVCVRPTSADVPEDPVHAPPSPPAPPPGDASVPDPEEFPATTIGAACDEATDCGSGELCLRSDADPFLAGGGPAEGYCSAECETDEDCPNAGSLCARTAGGGFCLRRCNPGEPAGCGERDTLVCEILPRGATPRGFCRPECSDDAQCGSRVCNAASGLCEPGCISDGDCAGRVCDAGTGVCVDRPPCSVDSDCAPGVCDVSTGECLAAPAVSVGGACTEDAECAADVCVPAGTGGFCSGICLLDTPLGCEAYGSDAFCLLPVQDDLGICLELCDESSDCAQPGFECIPLGGVINGRSGGCLPPPPEAP